MIELDTRFYKLNNRVSNYMRSHLKQGNMRLPKHELEENFNFYKDDKEFASVDFIICCFLASMCEGFLPLNKTIVLNSAHRYNIGRCEKENMDAMESEYFKRCETIENDYWWNESL